jgi:AcrR family transcriptional regulator
MRPAKVGPEAVGDALLSTFRAGGYAGASLKELARASGLKSASLYHRFPEGKVDMARAALARAADAFGPPVLDPLRAPGSPSGRLVASADGVRRFYDDGALACVLGVMTLSDAPPPVLSAVCALFESWTEALAGALADAGAPAPLAEAQDRIAGIQGALVLARGVGDASAFARAVDRLGRRP